MWTDPLVEEVRKRRRELMAEFDYDPNKLINTLKMEKVKQTNMLNEKNNHKDTKALRTRR